MSDTAPADIRELQREVVRLTDMNNKLKRLLLLTDHSVSGEVVGTIQLKQWGEFCKCYPQEGVIDGN